MKRFEELTTVGQARRLRRLAADALAQFGLPGAQFALIQHWENTTYRVDHGPERRPHTLGDPYVPGRYLLRLHRPDEVSQAFIASEAAWLEALARDTDICVPAPVHAPEHGAALVYPNDCFPGLGGSPHGHRVCSLLRWVPGRILKKKGRRRDHLRKLGGLMARLHQHATDWSPPSALRVNRWDGPTLMGRRCELGLDPDVWNDLPTEISDLFLRCEERLAGPMQRFETQPDTWGLIHADLHFNNVLFAGDDIRPIDFNDCGHGPFVLDIACALLHFDPPGPDRPWQDAFVSGYTQVRPLPPGTREHLDLFLAARQITLLLWCQTCARHRAAFREALPRWRESMLPDIRSRLQT